MENAARALEIAAGVLLGVLLMALIVYFFKSVGEWPQQEEDMATVEQIAKFNLEYEIYNKKGMYGVDVISCLNKAIDNDDKYLGDQSRLGFLTEGRNPKEYVINVFIKTKPELEEKLEVRYIDKDTFKEKVAYATEYRTDPLIMSDIFGSARFTENYRVCTAFHSNDRFITDNNKTVNLGSPNSGEYYSLLESDLSKYNETVLYSLIKFASDNMKITVKNTDSATLEKWSSATWTTALYSLKTKKFKCDDIKYNEKTGRICEIYFSEI